MDLLGVLVLLASCVNEIMDEEVLNKQVNDSATRAVPITSELRCEITTPATSGASILSSKGKFTVYATWNLLSQGELESVRGIEISAVDLRTGNEYLMYELSMTGGGMRSITKELTIYRPGSFGIQLAVVLSGRYGYYRKYSPYAYVNILFPTSLDAMSQFKYKMDICWEETKMTTKEYGFYVYLNGNSNMTIGEIYESEPTNAQGEASFNIERNESIFYRCDPRSPSFTFAVAQFHTHPPLTHASPSYWRLPGPSGIDMGNLPDDIPCLVYDYDRNELEDGKLYGGHKPNIPGTIYTYNGTRRPIN